MERNEAISKLFYKLQGELDTGIVIHTGPTWSVPKISATSTIGEQIKYYRRLAGIKQRDLALKLGYDRETIYNLGKYDVKLLNVTLLKDVIRELGI